MTFLHVEKDMQKTQSVKPSPFFCKSIFEQKDNNAKKVEMQKSFYKNSLYAIFLKLF